VKNKESKVLLETSRGRGRQTLVLKVNNG